MSYDQIVIGAGVVGAATARSLVEAGSSVLLLEAFDRGHDRGSSHGASRIFRHGYADSDYVELTVRALDSWRELESQSGARILEQTGAIDFGDSDQVDAIEAAMAEAGLSTERLTAEAATARWPGFHFDSDVLFSPGGGRLRADVAIEALLDAAERAGAELRFESSVESIELTESGVAIIANGRCIEAGGVVIAAGAWTPGLIGGWLAEQGSPLPAVRVSEEQPAHFPERPAANGNAWKWPSFVHHRAASATGVKLSSVYGLLAPGEGMKVGLHGTGGEVDPARRDRAIDPERLQALIAYVAEWVPGVDASVPTPLSCIYDTTATEDFVLDRVGPITVATGFSGHGFKFGPVLGELLAGLALHGTPAPERFRIQR